ncbi:Hypothetical_protein [Hexamita inflata]|uniref:Hypothetical_protein n=1 Tax=Hexamita inflata TaxID=28002 RepID=A0AA86NHL9_9EUKA|nr:Hypothetical protein HINF_LOCUS7767 [Hexamita inflata]
MGLDANNSYSQFCCTTVKYFPNDLKQFQDVKVRIDQQNYKQNHYTSILIKQFNKCGAGMFYNREPNQKAIQHFRLFLHSQLSIYQVNKQIFPIKICGRKLTNIQRTVNAQYFGNNSNSQFHLSCVSSLETTITNHSRSANIRNISHTKINLH